MKTFLEWMAIIAVVLFWRDFVGLNVWYGLAATVATMLAFRFFQGLFRAACG